MNDAAFRDLRRLADCFSVRAPHSLQIERLVKRLGVTAVAFLGRQMRSADPARRDAARDALGALASQGAAARARVIAELLTITAGVADDGAKVVAIGLLSELGEHADARFADPISVRVRSAIALAAHLETAADVAGAADLMVRQLEADDIVQMIEVMTEHAAAAAQRLACELAARLDLPAGARDRIDLLAAAAPASREAGVGGVDAKVLVDAAARLVVIASRRRAGEPRFRRWAVLIGATGRIDDCLHEEDAGADGDAAALAATLCADGYRIAAANTETDGTGDANHARDIVAQAARRTAESTHALPPPYYLGRDLLGLGDAHLGARPVGGQAALVRALELVAAGDHARAVPLLERCDPDHPDAAAALAACLLAQHRPTAALAALDRALAVEPDWPLHHWNRAAALHQLGDAGGCCDALRRFVATSALPSGLRADPEQPARLASAERMIGELERAARLTGRPLRRRARRKRSHPARPALSS